MTPRINWKGIARIVAKYFKPTIGSLFLLLLAWRVAIQGMSYEIAIQATTLLAFGGFISATLDSSLISTLIKSKQPENKADNSNKDIKDNINDESGI